MDHSEVSVAEVTHEGVGALAVLAGHQLAPGGSVVTGEAARSFGRASMTEDAYFDVDPTSNANAFAGSGTNYPYLPSGNVLIFSIQRGLFVVKPNLTTP